MATTAAVAARTKLVDPAAVERTRFVSGGIPLAFPFNQSAGTRRRKRACRPNRLPAASIKELVIRNYSRSINPTDFPSRLDPLLHVAPRPAVRVSNLLQVGSIFGLFGRGSLSQAFGALSPRKCPYVATRQHPKGAIKAMLGSEPPRFFDEWSGWPSEAQARACQIRRPSSGSRNM